MEEERCNAWQHGRGQALPCQVSCPAAGDWLKMYGRTYMDVDACLDELFAPLRHTVQEQEELWRQREQEGRSKNDSEATAAVATRRPHCGQRSLPRDRCAGRHKALELQPRAGTLSPEGLHIHGLVGIPARRGHWPCTPQELRTPQQLGTARSSTAPPRTDTTHIHCNSAEGPQRQSSIFAALGVRRNGDVARPKSSCAEAAPRLRGQRPGAAMALGFPPDQATARAPIAAEARPAMLSGTPRARLPPAAPASAPRGPVSPEAAGVPPPPRDASGTCLAPLAAAGDGGHSEAIVPITAREAARQSRQLKAVMNFGAELKPAALSGRRKPAAPQVTGMLKREREPGADDATQQKLAEAIRRGVFGEENFKVGDLESRLPPDRQTSYLTDGITPGKDLSAHERQCARRVFREIAHSAAEGIEKPQWSKVVVSLGEVMRHFNGRLSNNHIQRLCIYLGFGKRIRLTGYVERVGLLLTASPEDRFRVCFGLLDADGDGTIGARDVFAALGSSSHGAKVAAGILDATTIEVAFTSPGTIGLDLSDDTGGSKLDVVAVSPGSPAEQHGVWAGDRLKRVNGVDVEALQLEEVRRRLALPARPLRLVFHRGRVLGTGSSFVALTDAERLLDRLQSRRRVALRVTFAWAKGLRNADVGSGWKSDPYCVCEIAGKPHTRVKTGVRSDTLDPVWNDQRRVVDVDEGDVLRFMVFDCDAGSKADEELGRTDLPTHCFSSPPGFDGKLNLIDTLKGTAGGTLCVSVCHDGVAGIGFSEFAEMFGRRELGFLAPLTEVLTGVPPPASSVVASSASRGTVKLRIMMVSARGLRNADPGGTSDPFCVCEALGKPSTRVQTKVINNTLDPAWNDRRDFLHCVGDSLRFSVFDKDRWKDDLLGQITLTSEHFYPRGFDGEVNLSDGGKGHSPVLRLRIGVDAPAEQGPVRPRLSVFDAGAARQRHEEELEQLRSRQWLTEAQIDWYLRSFEAVCDTEDLCIRRARLVEAAERILGVPCSHLAGRLFEVLDVHGTGVVGICAWTTAFERLCSGTLDQKVAFAFELYDLDGDGVIAVDDALELVREVERLAGGSTESIIGTLEPLCEEMRWIYNLVADRTNDTSNDHNTIVDVFLLKQVRPQLSVVTVLMRQLELLSRSRPSVSHL